MVLSGYGDTSKLELVSQPRMRAEAAQIKVRVTGAGVNSIDWQARRAASAATSPLEPPTVLGREAAGVVVQIGADVRRLTVGTRVMGLVSAAYATFVVAPESDWVRVPDRMSLSEAAALPFALLGGAQLIEEALRPSRGDVLLVTGAVGLVGRAAVFVAKARGARVFAGVFGAERGAAERLGADGVVALDSDEEIAALPKLDGIADTLGGSAIDRLLPRLRLGGSIATVVGASTSEARRDVSVFLAPHADSARLAALAQAIVDDLLFMPPATKLPLSHANEALGLAERHPSGKFLLVGRARFPEERSEYLTRDDVLRLLGGGELAGALPTGLKSGDEFLDLDHLARGVQRAGASTALTGNFLARKSVHEPFWQRLLTQLSAAPL